MREDGMAAKAIHQTQPAVIETSKLLATVKEGNSEAIGRQLESTRKTCSAATTSFATSERTHGPYRTRFV
jgi:hypothetical protein